MQLRKVWHQSNRSLQLVAGIRNRLEQRQSYEMIQLSKSKVVSDYHKKSAHTSAILYRPSWHPSSIVFFLPFPVCPSLLLASSLPSLLSPSVFSPSCSSFPGQNNFDNFDIVEHAFKNNFGFKYPTYPHLSLLFFLLGLFIFRSLLLISLFPFVVGLAAAAAAARILVDAAEKPFDFFAHLTVFSIFNEAKVLPELLAKLQETRICSLTVFILFYTEKEIARPLPGVSSFSGSSG